MTHFALVENGIVKTVIVAEQDFIDTLPNKDDWVQTSFNTKRGIHSRGKTPLRKNYAGIGYTYDSVKDMFVDPKPFPSFILNKLTGTFEPPKARPKNTDRMEWNETLKDWVSLE